MTEIMLRFSHAAAGYGDRNVLQDVSFDIGEGEFVGLIGTNGTGKSTLLKCVSGLLPLRSGKIEICGMDTAGMKARERAQLVAVVPQSYSVDYDFTVEDIVMMGRNPYLSFRRRKSERDREIVEAAMKRTNTEMFRDRLYNELSGGERQRVILARAIAQTPQMILLDEPTSALDVHHQIEVMELIAELNRKEKRTVVAVLHDINLASRYCSRLIMLQNGTVFADGTPAGVVNRINMEELYHMKLVVRENMIFNKPEIIPIRTYSCQNKRQCKVHVIGGADGACSILEELDAEGYQVSAGILSRESDDGKMCEALGIPFVESDPFMEVSEEAVERNREYIRSCDAVIVTDTPFGTGNIRSLCGIEEAGGAVWIHSGIREKDFTEEKLLAAILTGVSREKQVREYRMKEDLINGMKLYFDEKLRKEVSERVGEL